MKNVFLAVLAVLVAGFLIVALALWRQSEPSENQQGESAVVRQNPTNFFHRSIPLDEEVGQDPHASPSAATGVFDSSLPSITQARIEFPGVFDECKEVLGAVRAMLQSPRHPSWRPGQLRGKLRLFARSGPESRSVPERVGTRTVGGVAVGAYEQVPRFTDEEVRIGKQRNAAARMAIMDHLLRSSKEDPPYMQRELVDLIWEWWWKDGDYRTVDDLIGEDILATLAADPTRPPATRAAAITRLPPERQLGINAIMAAVLRDDHICDSSMDMRLVSDAVRLLKESGGEEGRRLLAGASSSVRWKQALINQALGLPPPPLPEEKKEPDEQAADLDVVP